MKRRGQFLARKFFRVGESHPLATGQPINAYKQFAVNWKRYAGRSTPSHCY
jgi:hypothetical protein